MVRLSGSLIVGIGLLLAACSPGPSPLVIDGREVRTIEMTMTDDLEFQPDRVEVAQGETVRFFIRNVSDQPHEAYIGTAAEQELHLQAHAALPSDQQETTHFGYGISLTGFGSGQLVYHFGTAGEFIIGCHYPGHYEAGHRATIVVTPAPG